ncbi:MAG: asparagine synthetase B, partial [Planctomycetes bacterium]|nr:asparagine synthetase B [Planctomycetota bacterium]
MCGIAGIVSLSKRPVPTDRLKPMCDIQEHRGPDDAGYAFFRCGPNGTGEGGYWTGFADAKFRSINEHLPVLGGDYSQDQLSGGAYQVALGHRRLAIQDLSHYGHQPMSNSDRRFWIVFNGEIYNFPELRSELERLGYVFRTRCDTEVILKSWEQWGEESLIRFNGMFAFALYDRLANRLTLARDRFGVKPLYYSLNDDHLLFASEVKGILASGMIKPQLHAETLIEYFTFQNTFGAQTMFDGVHILEAGGAITLEPGTGRPAKFWSFHNQFAELDPTLSDDNDLSERVADAFAESVRR